MFVRNYDVIFIYDYGQFDYELILIPKPMGVFRWYSDTQPMGVIHWYFDTQTSGGYSLVL